LPWRSVGDLAEAKAKLRDAVQQIIPARFPTGKTTRGRRERNGG
jgi:hypothetical protein